MKKYFLLLLIAFSCTKKEELIVPTLPTGKIDIINKSAYEVTIQTVEDALNFKPIKLPANGKITVSMKTDLNFNTKITISVPADKVSWGYRFKEGFSDGRSTYSLDFAEYSVRYVIEGTMADAKISYDNDKGGKDSFDKVKLPFKIQYKQFQGVYVISLFASSNYKNGKIKGQIYFYDKLVKEVESTGDYPIVSLIYPID